MAVVRDGKPLVLLLPLLLSLLVLLIGQVQAGRGWMVCQTGRCPGGYYRCFGHRCDYARCSCVDYGGREDHPGQVQYGVDRSYNNGYSNSYSNSYSSSSSSGYNAYNRWYQNYLRNYYASYYNRYG